MSLGGEESAAASPATRVPRFRTPPPPRPGNVCVVNMVQKYQSPVRVYKYPFELVMAVSDPASSGRWLEEFSGCGRRERGRPLRGITEPLADGVGPLCPADPSHLLAELLAFPFPVQHTCLPSDPPGETQGLRAKPVDHPV